MSYLIRSFSVYLKSIRELGSVFVIAWGYRAGWWGYMGVKGQSQSFSYREQYWVFLDEYLVDYLVVTYRIYLILD